MHQITRRSLLKISATAAFVPRASPTLALAGKPLKIGFIGVGGRGAANLNALGGETVTALCDVDRVQLAAAAARYPSARTFSDYRQLLEMPDLDAVVISTPDHHHAPATVRALRLGLHVYCEKPLTHTVAEARIVAKIASRKSLATQMGTQNHFHEGYLRLVELLRTRAIGEVTEVHVITDRPGRWWPQGISRPGETLPIPESLHWDQWLGPAPYRPFHSAYVPFRWRGWWDFGCGAIGDMAIHLADPAFWGLELLGRRVVVSSSGPAVFADSAPEWMTTKFEFAARGESVPVTLHWYEGTTTPPQEIANDLPMNGSLYIGTEGRIAIAHDGFPKLLPVEKFAGFKAPEPFLPTSPGHHAEWVNACRMGTPTGSPFSYAGPFTEIILLGNVAYRAGITVEYDPVSGQILNHPEANRWLTKTYRDGWEVGLE